MNQQVDPGLAQHVGGLAPALHGAEQDVVFFSGDEESPTSGVPRGGLVVDLNVIKLTLDKGYA
jgi:hypothetical protein